MTDKTIKVPDITCGHCKSSIEGAVSKLPSVSRVEVNVENKQVAVTYDPPEALAQIVQAIEEQGFEIEKEK